MMRARAARRKRFLLRQRAGTAGWPRADRGRKPINGKRCIAVPDVLQPYMGGLKTIERDK